MAGLKKFPKLLRLPYLALKNVILHMGPMEIINLSLTSIRSKRFIKLVIPKQTAKLKVWYGQKGTIELSYNGLKLCFEYKSVPDTNQCLDFLCYIFNCIIHSTHFSEQYCPGHVNMVVDWLNSRQKSIEYSSIDAFGMKKEELRKALHNLLHIKQEFFYECTKIHNMQPIELPLGMKILRGGDLFPSFTIDNILKSNCEVISISNHHYPFTAMDMNKFLRGWIRGDIPNLKLFDVCTDLLDEESMLEGIKATRSVGTVMADCQHKDYKNYRINDGMEIRGDNAIATFEYSSDCFKMLVTSNGELF